jgi:hypothetical protein
MEFNGECACLKMTDEQREERERLNAYWTPERTEAWLEKKRKPVLSQHRHWR